MSIQSKITALTAARDIIRTKMVAAGQALATDKLAALATKLKLNHTETVTPTEKTVNDLGQYHDKRYVNTSGMATPNGTAVPSDVRAGKTFYGQGATKQTGTLEEPEFHTSIYNDTYNHYICPEYLLYLNGKLDSGLSYTDPETLKIRTIRLTNMRFFPGNAENDYYHWVLPFLGSYGFYRSRKNSSGNASYTRSTYSAHMYKFGNENNNDTANQTVVEFTKKCYVSGFVYSDNPNGVRHRVGWKRSADSSYTYQLNSTSKVSQFFSLNFVDYTDSGVALNKPNNIIEVNSGDKIIFYCASSTSTSNLIWMMFIMPRYTYDEPDSNVSSSFMSNFRSISDYFPTS